MTKICTYTNDDCHWDFATIDLCRFHYTRIRNGRDPSEPKRHNNTPRATPKACLFENCNQRARTGCGGYCSRHYGKLQREGVAVLPAHHTHPCSITWCEANTRSANHAGLCRNHYRMAWRYGLDPLKVLFLLDHYVCLNPGCGATENLHVDHDHACCPTGKFSTSQVSCGRCVRGLLCHGCNSALGMLQESPRRIQGLLDYLKLGVSG